jgi:hypothetical protein
MDYRLTLEIGNVELKILNLCKTAIQLRYSKDKFKREVDKLINWLCERIEYSYLKEKTRNSLRAYSERCYAKEWQIYTEMAAMYAVLLIGIERKERKAEAFKKEFDKTTSDRIRHSPGFLNIVNSKKNDSFYPHSLPLNVYHKTYMKRVEELTKELVDIEAKEDYKTNVSLRNIAEMTIRYEHQLDMIEEKRRSGKKLVYILAHANASERCQKYQVGGTKHSSGLYSLDGTSGTTEDGIKYVPLEFATNNPEDQYTTKAGITYQNGCLTGFNCRHKLGDYIPGVTPQPIDEKVIEKRRELETKQRDYERQIRKYKKAAIVFKETSPRLSQKYDDATKAKTKEYRKFVQENNLTYYSERLKLLKDDENIILTHSQESDIIYYNNHFSVVIPKQKLYNYALNPEKSPDKAKAFKEALGYDLSNYDELEQNIIEHINERDFIPKKDLGFGIRYECIIKITGPNQKSANVLTAWIQDGKHKRLTSIFVTKRKATNEN